VMFGVGYTASFLFASQPQSRSMKDYAKAS
jgi:hypothetical protein